MGIPVQAYLRDLLAEDRLSETIDLLRDYSFLLDSSLQSEIIVLSGRYALIRKQIRVGTIETGEITRERNRIRESLLIFLEEIPADIEVNPERVKKQKIKRRLVWGIGLLYLLTCLGLLVFSFQPKRSLRINGQLLVDRVSFRYLEGNIALKQRAVSSVQMYNYSSITIKGETLLIDKQSDEIWDCKTTLPNGSVSLSPDQDIPGIGINMGALQIEVLPMISGSVVSFSRPKIQSDPFQIQIEHEQSLKGQFLYKDSLDMVVEQVYISGCASDSFLQGPSVVRMFAAEGNAEEIIFSTYPGIFALNLFLRDTIALQGQGLQIAEPIFYEPVDQVAIPTILSGKIAIQEVGRSPVEEIVLNTGDAINLIGAKKLSLERCVVDKSGIFLSFSGRVFSVETGRNEELRNPSRLKWVWHNHKDVVLGICIIFLVFCGLLFVYLRYMGVFFSRR